jgi:hypothetical protein
MRIRVAPAASCIYAHGFEEPDLRAVVGNHKRRRASRNGRVLPDFFLSYNTPIIETMLICGSVSQVRSELGVALQNKGTTTGTEWMYRPRNTYDASAAVAGLMDIYRELALVFPLVEKPSSVDADLVAILYRMRYWNYIFSSVFIHFKNAAQLMREFEEDVVACCRKAQAVLAQLTTIHQTSVSAPVR